MDRIAIIGPIGSGKTTIARLLVSREGYHRLAFANCLRTELAEILEVPIETFDADKSHWRIVLQVWATEVRRFLDSDYWVKALAWDIEYLDAEEGVERFVVDDCRFLNEAAMLKQFGFQLVRLDCPQQDTLAYLIDNGKTLEEAEATLSHQSERELDSFDDYDHIIFAPRSRPIEQIYNEVLARATAAAKA